MTKEQNVFILSDAAGETAEKVAQAAFSQFPELDTSFTKFPFVKNDSTLEHILDMAKEKDAVIVHTIVSKATIHTIEDFCQKNNITYYDVINPIIGTFSQLTGIDPVRKKGLTHSLDTQYFDMISAMEFTLNNDDGQNPKGFLEADLVLLGISRTSKTPLSLYLANKGLKVANMPLVPQAQIPKELWKVDSNKVIGLTTDMNVLLKIRRQRMIAYGLDPNNMYSAKDEIEKELQFSNNIYDKIGCYVINTADRSIEETAALIMEQLNFNGFHKS
ncbi:pyruvate, water dikinase regulatory protein [Companilactobacillus furfuricola]|uniref:pyruvate, water dikinase regulatory protein n=1 Tax=Companilactobacillus furfuricola TaxID=1462575 RepID=UPI000F7AD275|nr:pyruvate, water dikinase regulatory protein [Companilactobacillus furfuricola]